MYYESVRRDFLDYFNCVEEYCVSIERNHVDNKVHLHAYLKYTELLFLNEVREFLSWYGGTLNIQSVKSRRNVLKYISKGDTENLFNCRESEVSFSYRSVAWSRRTPSFRYSDTFVLEHPQYIRLLQILHSEVRSGLHCERSVMCNVSEFWAGWCMQVLLYLRELFIEGECGKDCM